MISAELRKVGSSYDLPIAHNRAERRAGAGRASLPLILD
jgi:hypothetical protein